MITFKDGLVAFSDGYHEYELECWRIAAIEELKEDEGFCLLIRYHFYEGKDSFLLEFSSKKQLDDVLLPLIKELKKINE